MPASPRKVFGIAGRMAAIAVRAVVPAAALVVLVAVPAVAASDEPQGDVERGRAFVQAHCALCHAVGRTGMSSYPAAPPFRTLHERYPVESLAEAFAEGVIVVHSGPRQMPEFVLSPEQIDDLIAYLKSLELPPRGGRTGH